MRFGQTLRNSVYAPWKEQYVDYAKLKKLLREDASLKDDSQQWTEEDENAFCDEILNVQLEKVADFQASTLRTLEERTSKCSDKIRELTPEEGKPTTDTTKGFRNMEGELDSITNEIKELRKYSSVNYTAFLKIAKKHDRKRGNKYKLRPMLQIRLARRPFNSEPVYSPLLNRLSVMYFVIRQNLEGNGDQSIMSASDTQSQTGEKYTAYKC